MPEYEIAEQETVSTGVAKRVKLSLVVPAGADLAGAVRDAANQAQQDKWDVAFIFAYAEHHEVGTALPLARGRWIRKGTKFPPTGRWIGALQTITEPGPKGALDIAIEQEA